MVHHTSGETVLLTIWALVSLAILAVVCRIYARLWLMRNPGIDDWAALLSLCCAIGMTVAISYQVKYGLGKMSSEISTVDEQNFMKGMWAAVWSYHLAIGFTRLSIILQCMRVFPWADFGKTRWLVLYTLIAMNTTMQAWGVFSSIFFCDPISAWWRTNISPEHCLDQKVVWLFNSSMGMTLDFAVAIVPIPWLKQLKLPTRQKVMLFFVFIVAGLPCILAVIRVQALIQVATSDDPLYDNATLAVYSANELYVGIVCACLPTLKAFFVRLTPRFKDSAPAGRVLDSVSCAQRQLPGKHEDDTILLTDPEAGQDRDKRMSRSASIQTSNSSLQQTDSMCPTSKLGAIHVELVVEQEVEIAGPVQRTKSTHGSNHSHTSSLWQVNQWEQEASIYGISPSNQGTLGSAANPTCTVAASSEARPRSSSRGGHIRGLSLSRFRSGA